MGRLVVEEILPGGVCWPTPLAVETEGASDVVLGCWVGPFLLEVRFEPKPPNPLNRELIKSIQGEEGYKEGA